MGRKDENYPGNVFNPHLTRYKNSKHAVPENDRCKIAIEILGSQGMDMEAS